uniref:Pentacotripeptide-repeat region of PRORP domain-containing protein n=1 Tax=Leersia perrieri TaxID=77586 RepID=A0A0D9W756_9ORYZ
MRSVARVRLAPKPRASQHPLPPLQLAAASSVAALGCGSHPDAFYYASILSSLSRECLLSHARHPFDESPTRALHAQTCRALHGRILRAALPLQGRLGDALVELYCKSGRVGYAWSALSCVGAARASGAASSLLACHARSGSPEDVLGAFRYVRCAAGGRPDQFGLAVVLSACSRMGVLACGRQVHSDVIKSGFSSSAFCEAALVDMYAKCGDVADARRVFDGITCPDTICWSSMIACYHRIGHYQEALDLFSRMDKMGHAPDQVTLVTIISTLASLGRLDHATTLLKKMPTPSTVAWNAVISGHAQSGLGFDVLGLYKDMRSRGLQPTRSTFASMLSAAATMKAYHEGQQIHAAAARHGLDANVFVGSSLINLYAKCGCLGDAMNVFDLSCEKNIVMWNAMLTGFVQNELPEEAIGMFQYMRTYTIQPDEFTYVSILGACTYLNSFYLGKQVHCVTIKNRMGISLFVANATLDMYSKFGAIGDAKVLFSLIPHKDSVSWNALIVGLARNLEEEEAVCMLKRMRLNGVTPDDVSLSSAINACSNIRATETGKQIHCLAIKYSICSNHAVGSSLIDLYSKHGDVESSRKILAQVDDSSIVPINALIAGLVQNNNEDEARQLFQQFLKDGLKPSSATFSSILSGCIGSLSSVIGQQAHCYTLKSGLLYDDALLGVSLSGIYLKSKMLEDANKLFTEMPDHKNLFEWTAIISGYAQNGYGDHSLVSFWRMRRYNVHPDEATFASVLKACSDVTALADGKEIHGLIIKYGFDSYEIATSALIDMYSKCEAQEVIDHLPFRPDGVVWATYLAACQIHKDEERGKIAAKKLVELEPHYSSTYVVLSSLHAAAGNWAEAKVARESMREKGVAKFPGCSWITVGNKTSLFLVQDKYHPENLSIYEMLGDLTGMMKKCNDIEEYSLINSAEMLA